MKPTKMWAVVEKRARHFDDVRLFHDKKVAQQIADLQNAAQRLLKGRRRYKVIPIMVTEPKS